MMIKMTDTYNLVYLDAMLVRYNSCCNVEQCKAISCDHTACGGFVDAWPRWLH